MIGLTGFAALAVPFVEAQGTPTPTPSAVASPTPATQATPRPPFPVSFTPTSQPIRTDTYLYTIDQLGYGGDLLLRGILPSASIYPPVPENWEITDALIEVHLAHSALLTADSSITVEVNGTPVASIWLTPENVAETTWTVPIPRELLSADFLSITFSGYLKIGKEICSDPQNEGIWAIVKRDSVIRFNVRTLPFQPNLGRFPYPFFRSRALDNPSPLVVVPDSASAQDWAAFLPVAVYLGQKADWRKYGVYAVRESRLTDDLRRNYDLIFAGRIDQFSVVKNDPSAFSLRLGPDGKLLDQAGTAVPDDNGVVIETVSPWNQTRGVLLLAGVTPEGMRRAALAVIQPSFPSVARGNMVFVTDLAKPEAIPAKSNLSSATLEALGIPKDLSASGLGKHTLDVNFELPAGQNAQDAQVTVNFSHSPFVSTDRSFLNVILNDAPIKGVYLSADNENDATLVVKLPVSALHAGRNTLRFLAELRLNRPTDCDEQALNQAWITVHRDTFFSLTLGQTARTFKLSNFPVPFNEGAVLVIPSIPDPNELSGAFLLMAELGRELGMDARAIDVMSADRVDQDVVKAKHLILLGRQDNNSVLAEAAKSFPYKIDGATNRLSGPLSALSAQGNEPVGLLELMPSPWNQSRYVVAVTGGSDEAVGWSTLLLSDLAQRGYLAGDVAVIDSKGTLTSEDTRLPPPPPQGKVLNTRPTPDWVLPLLEGALALLIIVVILLIGRRLWAMSRRS